MKQTRNIFNKAITEKSSIQNMSKANEISIGLKGEKDQTNTMIGIFYILAISVAVGALFLAAFPEVGKMVVDAIKSTFTELMG